MSAEILSLLLRETLAAGAAIVMVLLLRKPARAIFGAQVAYALWLLAPAAVLAALLPARTVAAPVAARGVNSGADHAVGTVIGAGNDSMAQFARSDWASLDPAILLGLWSAGVVVSVLLLLRGQRRFMRNAGTAGPAVIGVARPRIVLPADFDQRYTPAERDLVIAHERAHIEAFDAQINAVAALALCFNWFNPLFYLARRALRIDQELACDARVMARHANARRTYAEAMLKTQLTATPVPLGCQWPPVGAQPLKERITMLARPRPSALRAAFGAGLCALAVFATAGAAWIAQPPRVAYAAERNESAASRALGRRLVEALLEGQMAEARDLVSAGADVNYYLSGDGTPLVVASRVGARDMVEVLIANGADVNQAAPRDGNPLIMASAFGHMNVVALLVEHGADVNRVVRGDETPLINAARNNRLDVARYLIAHGADVNLGVHAQTLGGAGWRSPLSAARRYGHDEMIRLLREHGAAA